MNTQEGPDEKPCPLSWAAGPAVDTAPPIQRENLFGKSSSLPMITMNSGSYRRAEMISAPLAARCLIRLRACALMFYACDLVHQKRRASEAGKRV